MTRKGAQHDKQVLIAFGQPCKAPERIMLMNEILRTAVGADLSRPPPIYRPGKGIHGPMADKSAVRQ
ncbi:MAG TPA: hypothetical protein VN954_08750 [Ktedonobacteraceae bacterium]|nr:hypothetical protein [Ktedonobacteraceae bacterium]